MHRLGQMPTHNCIVQTIAACGCGSSFAIMSGVRLSGPPLRVYSSTAGVWIGPCRVDSVPQRALPSLDVIWKELPAFALAAMCANMLVNGPAAVDGDFKTTS